jgi:hypothetical protein
MEAVYEGIDQDGVSMTFGLDAVITATVVERGIRSRAFDEVAGAPRRVGS